MSITLPVEQFLYAKQSTSHLGPNQQIAMPEGMHRSKSVSSVGSMLPPSPMPSPYFGKKESSDMEVNTIRLPTTLFTYVFSFSDVIIREKCLIISCRLQKVFWRMSTLIWIVWLADLNQDLPTKLMSTWDGAMAWSMVLEKRRDGCRRRSVRNRLPTGNK